MCIKRNPVGACSGHHVTAALMLSVNQCNVLPPQRQCSVRGVCDLYTICSLVQHARACALHAAVVVTQYAGLMRGVPHDHMTSCGCVVQPTVQNKLCATRQGVPWNTWVNTVLGQHDKGELCAGAGGARTLCATVECVGIRVCLIVYVLRLGAGSDATKDLAATVQTTVVAVRG